MRLLTTKERVLEELWKIHVEASKQLQLFEMKNLQTLRKMGDDLEHVNFHASLSNKHDIQDFCNFVRIAEHTDFTLKEVKDNAKKFFKDISNS